MEERISLKSDRSRPNSLLYKITYPEAHRNCITPLYNLILKLLACTIAPKSWVREFPVLGKFPHRLPFLLDDVQNKQMTAFYSTKI